MEQATFCKGCRSQFRTFTPIRGPLSLPFKLIGIKISRMSPNVCTTCEIRFKKIWGTMHILRPATVLFADIRGYTSLSERADSQDVLQALGSFYDCCAHAIWEKDGIVNKLIGDAVLAIFNYPIARQDHIEQAVYAGLELQKRCTQMKPLAGKLVGEEFEVGIGVGIHTGNVSIGHLGQYCKDFTAIGEVVNLGSRLQGVAKPGEVVLSEPVYERVRDAFPGVPAQTFHLKGIAEPVTAYVLVPG